MKIIIIGVLGRMGSELYNTIKPLDDISAVAVVDKAFGEASDSKRKEYSDKGIGVYTSLDELKEDADVLVNFAHHSLAQRVSSLAIEKGCALCELCTGHTEAERECIEAAARHIPVFFASNTSMGIAYIFDIIKGLCVLFPDADIEIVEAHHSKKTDVPSGTALMLANGIIAARGDGRLVVGRQSGQRDRGDVGVHSIRLNGAYGEHTVYIDTGSERIILKHIAHSRGLYVEGALRAIRFICDKHVGLYDTSDLLV